LRFDFFPDETCGNQLQSVAVDQGPMLRFCKQFLKALATISPILAQDIVTQEQAFALGLKIVE
jgi:hypothetical protein